METKLDNTINAFIYHKPNGRRENIQLKNIYKDDESDEHIELSLGKSCEETIKIAINKIKQLIS